MSATSARNASFAASIACAIDVVVSAPHARYSLVNSSSAPAEHFSFIQIPANSRSNADTA